MKRHLLLIGMILGTISSAASAQSISCPSGFSSSGSCGVSLIGAGGQPFRLVGTTNGTKPGFNGSEINLIPNEATHAALSLNYQTQVNVRGFTSTFTFVPNGQNVALVIQNSNNNPSFNGASFSAGAGCEGGFYQAFNQSPPNNVFALEFDSWSYLGSIQSFTHSSVQVYHSGESPCNPNDSGPGYTLINKISTSPVALDSPAGSQGTSTRDTYSATVTYDGSSLTLNLYDVTEGGACPGSKCFTNTWNNVNIPSWVGGNTAWVGFTAATGEASDYPLYIRSFDFSEGATTPPTQTQTATPTFSPASGTYSNAQSVDISDATSGATIYYTTSGIAPTTSSTRYTGPITVGSTETLRAIAVGPGGDAHSAVASAAYTLITLPVAVQEAYVYDTLAAGTYAYDASTNGKLTMIEGSPFKTSGSLVGTNGRFFITQGSGYVFAYQVESNGGIGKLISGIDTRLHSGSECGNSPQAAELDRTGAYVYALLGGKYAANGKACSAIQTFEIGKTGELTFKGSTDAGDKNIVLPAVIGNDKFAYSIGATKGGAGTCCQFTTFARESSGVLHVISAHDANPTHKPGTPAYSPISNPAPSPTDHFALTVEPQGGGLHQLASYTVDSQGNTSSTNTWENMPALPASVYDMVLDPTGKILAIATGQDIQFFHFNGGSHITPFTGITSGSIAGMAWDNHGHLYAQNSASGEMLVYDVTTTSVKELSGSPTAIPRGTVVVRTK